MKYVFSLLFSMFVLNCFSNNPIWQPLTSKDIQVAGERKIIPQLASVLKLQDAAFRSLQQNIPSENSGRSVLLELPAPDGTMSMFRVFERACMEPELAARYPSIKTYQAISVDNPTVIAKLDYTEFGFHAMVFSPKGIYFIDPYTNVNTGYYNCYYKKDYVRPLMNYSVCATQTATDDVTSPVNQSSNRLMTTTPGATDIVSDGKIRTFRLALACTIEYSTAVASPNVTKPRVLSAMVTSVNRINGVYEKELSIHMNLVAKNDTLIFIGSDNFSNNNGGAMLGENQTVCDARIGTANYDIGHVFSTGGGGVAYLGCVCNASNKARGVTGSSNPVGDGFDIDYVAHEMGHQFGANHTFNASTGSCSGNRNTSTAYEIGSGTTIMAYAGICTGNNPQPHSDDYFHRASLREIFSYISGTSCAVITNTGTATPTVNSYLSTYYIPYKTSFEVSASATDPAGHPLTYCWEEYDLGPSGSWNAANNTTAPILRSFLPQASPTRVFPVWDSLIKNNIKYLGEVLPEVTRDVKLRCTVRGLDPNGWGIYNAPDNDLTLKAVTTTTLFRVTSQASTTTFTGNTNQTIVWDVAGTTAAPISCPNVDIYFSLDSARTFPYLLASATANDGTETVLIPDVATNNASARIKVKGNGNVFFDLNDGWIKINSGTPPAVASFTASSSSVCQGTSITFTNTSTGSPDSVRWTINGGTPSTSTSATTIQSTFNTAGTYTISLVVYKAGVASTPFTSSVSINPTKTTNISSTICEGESVSVGSSVYNTNGVFVTHLQTSLGCDSAVTLNLRVNPKKTITISSTICEGESVTVGSSVYNTNGVFVTHLQTSLGCDSAVTLNLTVNPKKTTTISSTICEGESVSVGSSVYNTNGVFVTHLQTSLGCDSAVTLNLRVNPKKTITISSTICEGESVTVGSSVYNTNGVFVTHLQTSLGCDSAVTLNLTVNPKKTTTISSTICEGESVTVGSSVYNTNGVFVTHLQTSLGCDSAVTLNLRVNPKKTITISSTICEGESVTVGSSVYNTNGVFVTHLQTSLGCDSAVTLNLRVNPKKTTTISSTICEGESVTVGSSVYNTNGVFVTHLQTSLGCDSAVTLNLRVNPKKTTTISSTICEGESVTVGGSVYNTNGVFVTHLQTSLGCDSAVTLNLRVNPKKTTTISSTICEGESVTVGSSVYNTNGVFVTHLQTSLGCDSAVTLNLRVNPKKTTTISSTICEGESVTVGGSVYNTNGVFVTHLQTSLGCDSAVTLNLRVNPKETTTISSTICEGESVTVGSSVYNTNGVFVTHLQTSLGCDSAVTLNLRVNPKKTTTISSTICEGESVTVGGSVYNTNGVFVTHLQTSLGCDSAVTLNLRVNPKETTTISSTICEGESVTVGSSVYNTNGVFVTHLQTSLGCDSAVTLNLRVNPKETTNISSTICEGESVTVGSSVYNTNGVFVTHLQTSLGCDSAVTLNLTVNPKKTTTISSTICEGESVTVGSSVYNTNGVFVTHLQTSLGCDSAVTLNLRVNPKKTTTISSTICEGESVTVGSSVYNTNGVFVTHLQTSLGCDSAVTLNLTVNPLPATPDITKSNDTLYSNVIIVGATYKWYRASVLVATTTSPYYILTEPGLYSLEINNNGCLSAMSASFSYVTGIKVNRNDLLFSIVPNPNTGQFLLSMTVARNQNISLVLYNVAGQELFKEDMVLQKGLNERWFNLSDMEKGIYFISFRGVDGMATQSVIIQ